MSEIPPADFEHHQKHEDLTLLQDMPLHFSDDDFREWLTFFADASESDDTLQATNTQTSSLANSRLMQEDVSVLQENTDPLASAMTLQDSDILPEISDPFVVSSYKSVMSLAEL